MNAFRSMALAVLASISFQAPAEPSVQVGFSPEGSARKLVLETIGGAKHSIQMLAYAFQPPDIAHPLAEAEARGVEVRVVVIRNAPEVARQYLSHWQSRWEGGVAYRVK